MSSVLLSGAAAVQEPGFFGKIPARGDFVTRRLDPAVVKHLDDWLQLSLATSQRQMSDAWLPSYLETPIWRFIMGPGTCGDTAIAGVLMPSVDRVGRYFPLVLAAPLPGCAAPVRLIEGASGWFETVEALALRSLENGFDFDAFDEAARALGMPPYETAEDAGGSNGFRISLNGDGRLNETFGHILDQVLIGFGSRFSLWWTTGSDRVAASLLIAPGLPAPQNYAAFLDGRWERWGWERPADTRLKLDDDDLPVLLLKPVVELPSHGRTHPGTKRPVNQDAMLMRPDLGLWAVADGLGGHEAGEVASAAVVEALNGVLPPLSFPGFVEDAREALRDANGALRAQAAMRFGEQSLMASTAVVLLVYANHFTCLWAGDSRIYLRRGDTVRLLTADHVAVGLNGQRRATTLVTRAIGAAERIEIDMVQDTVEPGDRFLLCSDGVTKVLSDSELAGLLADRPARETVDAIVENVLVSGAPDNLTAIVVDIPAAEAAS